MTADAWAQLALLVVLLGVSIPVLGTYLARVYSDAHTTLVDDASEPVGPSGAGAAPGDRIFLPVERALYRLSGIDPTAEQRWTTYARSVLAFSVVSVLGLYLLQRIQGALPLNPNELTAVAPATAFNTATSFVTNTNWQSYSGESTMSYLTQMGGLAVQNFVSAAVGLAVAVALMRGLVRRRSGTLGNFWVDLTRGLVRVLLPISIAGALVFVSLGMIQNVNSNVEAVGLAGAPVAVPGGPLASQEAIKQLGTNGGGFFNANAAHPFSNPSGLSNLLSIYLLLVIPFSLTYTFGRFTKDRRQGFAVLGAMVVLWLGSALAAMTFESDGNPQFDRYGVTQQADDGVVGGNLEGKEIRFGSPASGLYAASTTGTSTGAVNSAHDSFTPAGGAVSLVNMMLGEVSPGGVGAGLYGVLVFALFAVFIAGLMVGRTPEYLGKKVQGTEIKLATIFILVPSVLILCFASVAVLLPTAASSILKPGPHGLSEIVYAYTSAANNNGSAFGGLTASTDWYDTTLGVTMLAGRFLPIVAVLAIAGSLARKQRVPVGPGTFPTNTPLFAGLLTGVIVIIVGLTYFPVVALGPIVEQLSL
ncbi:MAG: potassium-transporting ATPase subunit KdpA [Acidimicrobiales bacterium]|jgi:K+-transporting ATPase ATPase A chain|nr:potassium-transporting ATPase subunit KdpA [Acidimicrobiales bacterium]